MKKNRREQEEVAASGLFTIGSTVQFGKENWEVIAYSKESGSWEVVFRLVNNKRVKRASLKELEKFV